MSWDVFIMRFPKRFKDSGDIPSDWEPDDIGTIGTVRAALESFIPGIRWDDTGWGQGEGDGFSVEVSLRGADDAPTNGLTLMFRGGGDAAYAAMAIAERLGARAMGSGEFLEPDTAADALAEWHRFRARAHGSSSQN